MDQNEQLLQAAEDGNLVGVEQALSLGANINTTDYYDDETPLHWASRNGHEVIVDMLLKANADVSVVDKYGNTPLHWASREGHEVIVDMLLKANANVSVVDENGYTPLHLASYNGHEAIVDTLLKANANVSVVDENGYTPLHLASYNGHEAIVDTLLKGNADVSVVNKYGNTPLHWASREGHEVIVDMLLKANANVSVVDEYGNTPLHWASREGHEVIVDMLLKANADVSVVNKYDETPLHLASRKGHEVIVDMLLKANANVSVVDEYDETPLHWASHEGHEVIVDMLLKGNADVSVVDEYGNTPLHWASREGHEVIVDMLLKGNADVSVVDEDGNTPLHVASNFSIRENLIRYGANIHIKNKSGESAKELHAKDSFHSLTKYAANEKKRQADGYKLFLKQCENNGTVDILPVKCVLTGLPRVGKTSFLKRVQRTMTSQTVPRNKRDVIPSTGFEAPVTVNIAEEATTVSTATIKKGCWVVSNDVHEQGNIFLSSMKRPKRGSHDEKKTATQSDKESPTKVVNSPVKLAANLPRPSISIPKAWKRFKKQDLKSAKALIEKAVRQEHIKEFEEGGPLTQVYFIDTGGQIEFHDLLPPLLHGSAFHLIFFNAFLSLFKAVEVEYRHKDKNVSSTKYETSSSSIEIIQQLLVSFYSISKKEELKSVAALFGSYIDQFSSDPDELARQLQDVSDSLQKHFSDTSFYQQKFLVQPFKEDCPYIFQPLDNITCPEDELERVQQFIFDVVNKQFSPITLPITWAMFHLALREKYENSPGVCNMKECINLADDFRIPAKHVSHVLDFFHFTLGTILYYQDVHSLKDYIVVNPNILFSGISKLVALSFIGSGEHSDTTRSIRKTGEIPTSDLQLNQPLSEDCPLTNQHLVDLLVHYKLLDVSRDSLYYFMPCLLLPDKEVVSSLVSLDILSFPTPPMLILFEEGFVPISLFSGLVNSLSQKWDLDKSNRFRNRVKFITPPGYVELRQCLKYIEIRAVEMALFYSNIREEAVQCLEGVIAVQPHLKATEYSIGFYCPGSLSTHLHACKYSCKFVEALICTKDPKCFDSKPLSPRYRVWFEKISQFEKANMPVESDTEPVNLTSVDNSLLAENAILPVLCECYDVVQWKILGSALGITEAVLYRIDVDKPNELLRLQAALLEWLSAGSASWRGLVNALLYSPLKATSVARTIAENHPVVTKQE